MALNPFDWAAEHFLILYGALLLMAIIAGALIPRWLRPEGQFAEPKDPEALAFLAGGTDRFAESVASTLLARGALRLENQRFTATGRRAGASGAERALADLPAQSAWNRLRRILAREARAIEARLVDRGLLIGTGERWQMRFFQTLPYLLLLGFGELRLHMGVLRDRPVGFLLVLLALTAMLAVLRFAMLDRRTRSGIELLSTLRVRMDRLRRAPTPEETGLAVALFGTSVLALSSLEDFHRLRTSNGDGGSSGGEGTDGGDGGSGGCGGCGGGGGD